MAPFYYTVQFNGNLRFFLYLEFSLSRNNFAISCEFEIERIHSMSAKNTSEVFDCVLNIPWFTFFSFKHSLRILPTVKIDYSNAEMVGPFWVLFCILFIVLLLKNDVCTLD